MKSVSNCYVTWKTPIKTWHRHITAWPQIRIVRLPNLKIATGDSAPQTKLATPMIKVPFWGDIGNSPLDSATIFFIKVVVKIQIGPIAVALLQTARIKQTQVDFRYSGPNNDSLKLTYFFGESSYNRRLSIYAYPFFSLYNLEIRAKASASFRCLILKSIGSCLKRVMQKTNYTVSTIIGKA